MATTTEIVAELGKAEYSVDVAAGKNSTLVARVNAANPFPRKFKNMSAQRFRQLTASELVGLSVQQQGALQILLADGQVDLSNRAIRSALSDLFSVDTKAAIAVELKEDDLVTLNDVRAAVLEIPTSLIRMQS